MTDNAPDFAGLAAQLLTTGVLTGLQYAALAVSIGIIYSTTRTFHFAHSVTYTVGAYSALLIAAVIPGAPVVAALGAMLTAALFGMGTEVALYRPLRKRGVASLGIFLASLGLATIGPNAIQIIFGPQQQKIAGLPDSTVTIGPVSFTTAQVALGIICLLMVLAVAALLRWTRLGQAVLATKSDHALATAVGVPVRLVHLVVFALGSAIVGLIAYMNAAQFAANPVMGIQPLLFAFIGMFLGGIERLAGWLTGGFILALVSVGVGYFFTQAIGQIAVFAILIVVLIWRPSGLVTPRKG
ncbi:branched-chain amino acid ABC transporter permease [Microbacterium sp. BR1]|uniref:branched-chain amino acid ABC transporter permease n=1 Tax=Microbacterium sp. BR1 TaxID=1070896 RepID=UPI0012FDF0C4|nr:branched-chain amino acid ABC transporter permease [Microbacterium sp. BR1]